VIEKYSMKKSFEKHENLRKIGSQISEIVEKHKITSLSISEIEMGKDATLALVDGIVLSGYKFLKYKNMTEKKIFPLLQMYVLSDNISEKELQQQSYMYDGVFTARDLVNEPPMYLTATELANKIDSLNKSHGLKTAILNKKIIEKEKMAGLLTVAKGSNEPPIFGIMEYNPVEAVNKRPIVLIGKGVVFDAGGLDLKSAENMKYMKADMSGAATVIGIMQAISASKFPVRVIGLIPAVDNRPGQDAYCPGDVLRMMNGLTVEIINTDAEGRLILADALCYATKFAPQIIFSIATLTGSAQKAFGRHAIACLSNAHETFMKALELSSQKTYERIAMLPNFDEYELMLKSDVADIKNLGGSEAGMITAGKFLQKFTEFPLVHLDIAGTAFAEEKHDYIPKGGTGYGVRLMMDFLRTIAYEAV
jgi:leucyl aminopeptidase